MANRLKRRSLAVATPIHSPSGSQETDRDSPMVIPPDEVRIWFIYRYRYHQFRETSFLRLDLVMSGNLLG